MRIFGHLLAQDDTAHAPMLREAHDGFGVPDTGDLEFVLQCFLE